MTTPVPDSRRRIFGLKVMGRTFEHLGTQLYKRRDAALAELIANSWDAGATKVEIKIPVDEGYDQDTATITVLDNGAGMDEDAVQDQYLVVGRNRRADGEEPPNNRKAMGRKGIGKLAGFGLAKTMTVETWTDGFTTSLVLDVDELKRPAGETDNADIEGEIRAGLPEGVPFTSGTRLTLEKLKHPSAPNAETLRTALARRFSRTVQGEMTISVNDVPLETPAFDLELRFPPGEDEWETVYLDDATMVRYWYGFTKSPISTAILRGWTILVRGKTAQAGNFFFGVEGTASGQHGTKYMTGVIEADEIDEGSDDESDVVSTDRQELDWDDPRTAVLDGWGKALTRKALIARTNHRATKTKDRIYDIAEFKERIQRLDPTSRRRVEDYLAKLGEADADDEKTIDLADQLIRAFEYQHFHDLVGQIEDAEDPDQLKQLLEHLNDWKVLESRAVLEIVAGRLAIVDSYKRLLDDNAPETPRAGKDNLHDLLAEYPWLIHPEWQVLSEEKQISTQLREWGDKDAGDDRMRYDFLALTGGGELFVIEIKRSGHPVELAELQRLEQYKAKLEASERNVRMVFISGGNFAFDHSGWLKRDDIDLLTWSEIYTRTKIYYEHYRAVLNGDVTHADFSAKTSEFLRTQRVLESGVARGAARRKEGLGNQDVSYVDDPSDAGRTQ